MSCKFNIRGNEFKAVDLKVKINFFLLLKFFRRIKKKGKNIRKIFIRTNGPIIFQSQLLEDIKNSVPYKRLTIGRRVYSPLKAC